MKITQEQLVKKLESVGINASAYARAPISRIGFIMSNAVPKCDIKLYLNPNADIDIEFNGFSKSHKQVAFTVTEQKRVIEEVITLGAYDMIRAVEYKDTKSRTIHLMEHSRLTIPGPVRRTVSYNEYDFKPFARIQENYVDVYDNGKTKTRLVYPETKITINHHVPKTVTHFLVGIDEQKSFICALPKKPKGIKDAHDILRPKNVPSDAKRQGEFFLVPATKSELKAIYENVSKWKTKTPQNSYMYIGNRTELETNSSHYADFLVKADKKVFATGKVRDRRSGRHAPVELKGWHKVVRNQEVVFPKISDFPRYWD